ncbi:OprO/OprP family phosphate-selective porin [Paraglaciecola polaris]|uniref:Outer membrane porin n=1 Tax=Paraglaciecola polaris LMG 21857 TaxID=1129793 RepID=K7A270_9ALTE|nr:porin [Paraglaciecola polaris]GAC35038.1 outer membrane porin [Paraglaciecola polaris LMG 21857]
MKLKSHLIAYFTLVAVLPVHAVAADNASAEVTALVERLNQLEQELRDLRSQLTAVELKQKDQTERVAIIKDSPDDESPVSIKWKGAPEIKGESGWSVKPKGRVLYDFANLSSVPSTIDIPGEGFSSEARRLRFGIQGTMPGGFGYKLIADYLDGVVLTDAYMSYQDGPLKIIIGQQNTFQGLEELSSSNDTSFVERSAFTDAFGFERRVGLSATYNLGDFMLEGGIFSDNIDDLNDGNNSFSVDGRVTYATLVDDALIHLGSSVHIRDLGDEIDSIRYRQRPLVHSVDTRFINTDQILGAEDELSYGLEAAVIAGRFHMAAETHWAKINRVELADPTFFGGSIEAGYFLTQDQREYKGGVFKGVKVSNPVGNGGTGAWQINLRFDRLDLVDAGIVGGEQDAYMASLIWTPVNNVRFLLDYGHLAYSNALDIVEGAPKDFSVNVLGARTQLSF